MSDEIPMPPRDGCLYKLEDGHWKSIPTEYSLDVTVHYGDATVDVKLRNAMQVLSRWVFNTREQAVRDALIKLGWTPPSETPPDYRVQVQDRCVGGSWGVLFTVGNQTFRVGPHVWDTKENAEWFAEQFRTALEKITRK